MAVSLPLALGRRVPLIRQTEAAECGLACLAMVAGYHGYRTDLTHLRHRHRISLKGITLAGLMDVADGLGLDGRPVRLEPVDLPHLRLPAILHWDMNHFLVLERTGARSIDLCDPATGRRRISQGELGKHFTGVALELQPRADFERKTERASLRLRDLWSRIKGLTSTITLILFLTVMLQLFTILGPFYLQLTVDEVLVKSDADLLAVLALAFGAVVILQSLTQWLRGHVIVAAGSLLNYQMALNVFAHLIRLPVTFFEQRHIGDIISRFDSLRAVKDFLTYRLVEAVVDGIIASVTLLILFLYSVELALVVLGALGLFLLLRLALYGPSRRLLEENLIAQARIDSQFIESFRGITTIRLFGREAVRQRTWQNGLATVVNATARTERLALAHEMGQTLILGLETIAVVYLAARMTLAGAFTVGMLFAFMAYKQMVTTRATQLIDHFIELRMLGLHLERLGDLVLNEQEALSPAGGSPRPEDCPGSARLELRDVGFRYANNEPWIFEHLNMTVEPREMVAIVGPSGQGKTTLMKVMLGLLPPTSGEVRVDGRCLEGGLLASYRRRIGVVRQDDQLFSGSIAENITFFDPQPDMDFMVECARIAAIDEDIAAMPMGYESLIGDMGSALSGGQKQRLFIARALYRRPTVLFLDESTSHLDAVRERAVQANLETLNITQVVIAHRETTIAAAHRVLHLGPTGLVEE